MIPHILVVNDTQEILELFRQALMTVGYRVTLHGYATHDLREIELLKPDLIILDYMIGEEASGWQLLQKLKMHPPTEKIPVIVCTAATKLVQQTEGYLLSKGVTVVPKPFTARDLLDTVKLILQNETTTSGQKLSSDERTRTAGEPLASQHKPSSEDNPREVGSD